MVFVLTTECLGPCPTMPLSSLLSLERGAWLGSGPAGLSSLPCLLRGRRGCLAARELALLLPRGRIGHVSAGEAVGAFGDLAWRTC